jgi:hypothetical protein
LSKSAIGNLWKRSIGALGIGAVGLLGLSLLSNSQAVYVQTFPTIVPLTTEQNASYPTPDPNSEEYKQVLMMACDAIINGGDMDCGDFESHYEAQRTYDNLYKCYGTDIFKLDRDGDGIACELSQ